MLLSKFKITLYPLLFALAIIMTLSTYADIDRSKLSKDEAESLQRASTGVFDLQRNTISNIDFYTTNYGIFGFDVARSVGGTFWPRGSNNQYIFGGGVWFGATKQKTPEDANRYKYVLLTYNPNDGRSWCVPGRIREGGPFSQEASTFKYDPNEPKLFRSYFSTDFSANGQALNPDDGSNWPIWDASTRTEDTLKTARYFGYYIPKNSNRNKETYKKGPAFISAEDVFSTFKDTDLSRYPNRAVDEEKGYPMQLQFEKVIYSWGFGEYRDFLFLKYEITNYSKDTLWDCWLAPVMDVDIAERQRSASGAGNDRVKFVDCDSTLNMAAQWTNGDRGERGKGFGYLGFDFLESPSVIKYFDTIWVDPNDHTLGWKDLIEKPKEQSPPDRDFVRKDKNVFVNSEQLGLNTFRNWSISDDKLNDEDRYNFISAGIRDGDTGPGDKRFMMATGPFHMRPGDTVRTVVGIILANASNGSEADGSCSDMGELIKKDKFAQEVYDNNFRAPIPPVRSNIIKWDDPSSNIKSEGFNNAVRIVWDDASEFSVDDNERGLDFMGYKIFRARRTNLDTFDINTVAPNNEFTSGKGPLGWKLLAEYRMPTPFNKSYHVITPNNIKVPMPFIDSLIVLGPDADASGNIIDSMSFKVMRIGKGFIPETFRTPNPDNVFLHTIRFLDTSMIFGPWGSYYNRILNTDPNIYRDESGTLKHKANPYNNRLFWYPGLNSPIFDSLLVGTVRLNPALHKYNPMFFQRLSKPITGAQITQLENIYKDGIVGELNIEFNTKTNQWDTTIVKVDSVVFYNTLRLGEFNGVKTYMVDMLIPHNLKTGVTTYYDLLKKTMNDFSYVNQLTDSLYQFILNKSVEIDFPDVEQRMEVISGVIKPYMSLITNNRTFVDIGDDRRDGYIDDDGQIATTEKLYNNVPYYYKVLAYDEGDYQQPTDVKINEATLGLPNIIEIMPTAAPIGKYPEFETVFVDTDKIGGLYNFKLFGLDKDRIMQKYAGKEFELEFQPFYEFRELDLNNKPTDLVKFGLYRSLATLTEVESKDTIYRTLVMYEKEPCQFFWADWLTDYTASQVLRTTDTIDPYNPNDPIRDFGTPYSRRIKPMSGLFSTGDFKNAGFCYANGWDPDAYGTLGISFNFGLQQWGGRYRPDTIIYTNSNATLKSNVSFNIVGADKYVNNIQRVGWNFDTHSPIEAGFNNGPGSYDIEFLPGGEEELTLSFNNGGTPTVKKFRVPYLVYKVTNKLTYRRGSVLGDSVEVKYPSDIPLMQIPLYTRRTGVDTTYRLFSFGQTFTTELYGLYLKDRYYPDPRNLALTNPELMSEYLNKFTSFALGFAAPDGTRNTNVGTIVERQQCRDLDYTNIPADIFGTPIGKQGRYYLTGKSLDGAEWLDFTNFININGAWFVFNYANKPSIAVTKLNFNVLMGREPTITDIGTTIDFKAGEKILANTYGGALGLPLPGAKVRFKISESKVTNITDSYLDQIMVVPNPYIVTHQGVKSPYDSKLYFTKLPNKCTIDIYTVTGDLVQSISHDIANAENSNEASVEVWNLLTKNGQRAQSQTLVAIISTPDGSQTVKTFSIVVGGFRLLQE